MPMPALNIMAAQHMKEYSGASPACASGMRPSRLPARASANTTKPVDASTNTQLNLSTSQCRPASAYWARSSGQRPPMIQKTMINVSAVVKTTGSTSLNIFSLALAMADFLALAVMRRLAKEQFGAFAHGFGQRRMRMDGGRHVFGGGAHFDGEHGFGNQRLGLRADHA